MNETQICLLDGLGSPDLWKLSEAVYFPPMDYILYLRQDSAYVADRIDEYLTLLLCPVTDAPIGVKLKGIHNIYLAFKKVWEGRGVDLEAAFPFKTFITLAEAYACDFRAKPDMTDRHKEIIQHAYDTAKRIVGDLEVSAEELTFAEAA